jgi:chemotaxis protein CheD
MADMKVACADDGVLITYALGSCLGITVYDPVTRVGGMVHVMLPLSRIDREKAQSKPYMFVDTGVPELFREAYRLGAQKERLVVKVAGSARILDDHERFKIGERNFAMLRKILWKNHVLIKAQDVGG